MWHEFRAFAMRGNVVDLAIGIILGAASNKPTRPGKRRRRIEVAAAIGKRILGDVDDADQPRVRARTQAGRVRSRIAPTASASG